MRLPNKIANRRASKCGIKVEGRTYSVWPVHIRSSSISDTAEWTTDVIAPTASDAAHFVRSESAQVIDRPFEVTVVGPKGGIASYLFAGWERLIGLKMFATRPVAPAVQLKLWSTL